MREKDNWVETGVSGDERPEWWEDRSDRGVGSAWGGGVGDERRTRLYDSNGRTVTYCKTRVGFIK